MGQPFRFELSRKMLGRVLGWHPDGLGVEEVDAFLREGVGVDVFTRQAPHEGGCLGISYRLLPFTGKLPEGEMPPVELVLDLRHRDFTILD
jgi:hypothetical protein